MKQIELTDGLITLIDDDDFELVSKYKWRPKKDKRTFYAVTGRNPVIKLHKCIIKTDGFIIDHIDGNGLNNQKSNLRIAANAQNVCNRRVSKSKINSNYLGVHLDKGRWWFASIKNNGLSKKVYCKTEIEAALKYNELATFYHKDFAKLNIVTV